MIQVKRFRKVVDSIGSATITEIAESGPRAQVCVYLCVRVSVCAWVYVLMCYYIDCTPSFVVD